MDNGPELIARALRDWCRLGGTGTVYIEPGSPVGEPLRRIVNGRIRDELLNVEEFGWLTAAQVLVEAWRTDYNNYRPHSALDGLAPAEYAGQWTTPQQPALSYRLDRSPGRRHTPSAARALRTDAAGNGQRAILRALPRASWSTHVAGGRFERAATILAGSGCGRRAGDRPSSPVQ
jgi:hypothetical protein